MAGTNGKKAERFPELRVTGPGGTAEVFRWPDSELSTTRFVDGRLVVSSRGCWGWRRLNGRGRPVEGSGSGDSGQERCKALASARRAAGPGAVVTPKR